MRRGQGDKGGEVQPAALAAMLLAAACGSSERPWWDGGPSGTGGPRAPMARPVQAVAPGGTYVVRRGDTVHSIARALDVPLRSIIDANRLRPPYTIEVGQRLTIPAGRFHVVQSWRHGLQHFTAAQRRHGVADQPQPHPGALHDQGRRTVTASLARWGSTTRRRNARCCRRPGAGGAARCRGGERRGATGEHPRRAGPQSPRACGSACDRRRRPGRSKGRFSHRTVPKPTVCTMTASTLPPRWARPSRPRKTVSSPMRVTS